MSEVTAGFERIFERYLACSSICCKLYYLIISQQLFHYKGKLLNTYLGHTAKLQKARLLRRHRAYVHIHGIFIISTLNSGRIIRVLVFSKVPGYPVSPGRGLWPQSLEQRAVLCIWHCVVVMNWAGSDWK